MKFKSFADQAKRRKSENNNHIPLLQAPHRLRSSFHSVAMDIRSFFGGGGGPKPDPAAVSQKLEEEAAAPTTATATVSPTPTEAQQKEHETAPVVASPAADGPVDIPAELADIIDWAPGANVPYKAVADAFERIGATSGRLEKESILCRCIYSIVGPVVLI